MIKIYTVKGSLIKKLDRVSLERADLSGAILCDANLDGAIITYRGDLVKIKYEEVSDEKQNYL